MFPDLISNTSFNGVLSAFPFPSAEAVDVIRET